MSELINESFNKIRNSEELGIHSLSTIDEFYDDAELKELIEETILEYDCETSGEVFDVILQCEPERVMFYEESVAETY